MEYICGHAGWPGIDRGIRSFKIPSLILRVGCTAVSGILLVDVVRECLSTESNCSRGGSSLLATST